MAIIFSDIDDLKAFINTKITANGAGLITGPDENSIGIALADFIVSYGVNTLKGDIVTGGGNVLLTKPVTLVSGVLPSTLAWQDNVQHQFYIVNTLGVAIPLADGFSYLNEALVEQTNIPALSVVQIMQLENGSWAKVNTATSGAIEIPNQSLSPAIDVSGTLDREIDFLISEDDGNTAEIRDDGLFVPGGSGSGDVTQIDF